MTPKSFYKIEKCFKESLNKLVKTMIRSGYSTISTTRFINGSKHIFYASMPTGFGSSKIFSQDKNESLTIRERIVSKYSKALALKGIDLKFDGKSLEFTITGVPQISPPYRVATKELKAAWLLQSGFYGIPIPISVSDFCEEKDIVSYRVDEYYGRSSIALKEHYYWMCVDKKNGIFSVSCKSRKTAISSVKSKMRMRIRKKLGVA